MLFTPFLSASSLTSLMGSRLCHDLISPIGALNNALELYEEGGMEDDAFQLMGLCARNASARLQFFRMAFGMSSAYAGAISGAELENIAQKYIENEKSQLVWDQSLQMLSKEDAKIAFNMLLLAIATLPRGGKIKIYGKDLSCEGKNPILSLVCEGPLLQLPEKFLALYEGRATEKDMEAKAVQFYYTLLLIKEAQKQLSFEKKDDAITFFIEPSQAPRKIG